MFSTQCSSCRQLINMKTEEVRAAIAEAESKGLTHYAMPCPKCRKPVKIQVKELKRKLPPVTASEHTGEHTENS